MPLSGYSPPFWPAVCRVLLRSAPTAAHLPRTESHSTASWAAVDDCRGGAPPAEHDTRHGPSVDTCSHSSRRRRSSGGRLPKSPNRDRQGGDIRVRWFSLRLSVHLTSLRKAVAAGVLVAVLAVDNALRASASSYRTNNAAIFKSKRHPWLIPWLVNIRRQSTMLGIVSVELANGESLDRSGLTDVWFCSTYCHTDPRRVYRHTAGTTYAAAEHGWSVSDRINKQTGSEEQVVLWFRTGHRNMPIERTMGMYV